MKVLVTGASGFLGRNLILEAPPEWRIVAVYNNDTSFPRFLSQMRPGAGVAQCDLTDPDDAATLIAKHGREWDACVHLAGTMDMPRSLQQPRQDLFTNAGALLNVLENIRCGRFIYLSSRAVYESLQGHAGTGVPLCPTLPFAISKLASEEYVRCFHLRRKSIERYLIVRLFGAYGPYEAPHKIHTRLVRALAFEGADSFEIYGSGRNLVDLMYAGDVGRAICLMVEGSHWNDAIDLASGQPMQMEELVRTAAQALGVPSVRIVKRGRPYKGVQYLASTRRLREEFDFEPRITPAAGIRQLRDFLGAIGEMRTRAAAGQ